MSKSKPPPAGAEADPIPDWRQPGSIEDAVARAIGSLIQFILHALPIKPADPAAWEHLEEADRIRRHLHSEAETEVLPLTGPHAASVNPNSEGDK